MLFHPDDLVAGIEIDVTLRIIPGSLPCCPSSFPPHQIDLSLCRSGVAHPSPSLSYPNRLNATSIGTYEAGLRRHTNLAAAIAPNTYQLRTLCSSLKVSRECHREAGSTPEAM